MADHIRVIRAEDLIRAAVSRGWPRDYAKAKEPCWYVYPHDGSANDVLEDPDAAPDIRGRQATLAILPTKDYMINVGVDPDGLCVDAELFTPDCDRIHINSSWGDLDSLLIVADAVMDGFRQCLDTYNKPLQA